jgi:hypothetical protein
LRKERIPSNVLELSVVANANMDNVMVNGIHNHHELRILPVDIENFSVNSGDLFEEIIASHQNEQIPITWLDSAMVSSCYFLLQPWISVGDLIVLSTETISLFQIQHPSCGPGFHR